MVRIWHRIALPATGPRRSNCTQKVKLTHSTSASRWPARRASRIISKSFQWRERGRFVLPAGCWVGATMSLGMAILDFAALIALAIAAKRNNWRTTSAVCGLTACATLAWGVTVWLFF